MIDDKKIEAELVKYGAIYNESTINVIKKLIIDTEISEKHNAIEAIARANENTFKGIALMNDLLNKAVQ